MIIGKMHSRRARRGKCAAAATGAGLWTVWTVLFAAGCWLAATNYWDGGIMGWDGMTFRTVLGPWYYQLRRTVLFNCTRTTTTSLATPQAPPAQPCSPLVALAFEGSQKAKRSHN